MNNLKMVKRNIILILLLTFLVYPQYSISQTSQVQTSQSQAKQKKLAKLVYKWHANKISMIEHCGMQYRESSPKVQQAKRNYLKLNQKEISSAKLLLGSKSAGLIEKKINTRYKKLPKGEFHAIFEAQSCKKRVNQELKATKPNLFRLRWEDGLKKVSGTHLRTCLFRKFNKMYLDRYLATIKADISASWRPPKGVSSSRCTVRIVQNTRGKVLNVNYLKCNNIKLKQSAASALRKTRLPRAPCKEVFNPHIRYTF